MLYTDDLCGEDLICNYDIFIPQGQWSKVHVQLWAEHFNRPLKTRNKALSRAFEKEHMRHRVVYPFLDESQILGKTYTKFYIPNICGKISKTFLQKYTSSRRYQKKIGNFDLKTPYSVLREEHLPEATKEAFNIPVKTIGDIKKKRSNQDSSFVHCYDFYSDETTAKISDAHDHLEITEKYKHKNVSNNSVQNNVNKENVIPNNSNDLKKRSIMKEKDDQILKEQFLIHDGSVFLENKTTKFNDEFGKLNSSLSELNTKPNIKKSVRFNDTKLCSYESSYVFNTDSSQNSTVPTETELLFDLYVKRQKQTQKKDANYVSDNIEKLSEKPLDDLSLNISKEKYSNGKQNQTSLDSWEMEIDSTTTNTSTVDFILPTPEENNKSTSEFGKKYAYESINILNQIEECNINNINLNHDFNRKNTSIEIHSDTSSFNMNTLNSSTDKYMTNTTSDYNCNLESISDIKQQMQIDETGHFEYINKLEKADRIDKMNTSNVKIPVIISESDTNTSTINFISPTPETNNQNKNELCQKPTYKIVSCDKLDHVTDETGKFVDENKLKDIIQLNQIKSNAKVSLVINESEFSNHETNAIPVETKENEQANNFPESHLEYSSDSSGRIYEDDMCSQDFTNATSVEISQKELDMDVLEDSQQVKEKSEEKKQHNKDMTIRSFSNSIIFDSWEQSNNNGNIVCSSVDDNAKLSCRIVGNNMNLTGDKICSGQPVSPTDNTIIINESQETGSNEIFESQNDRLEAIKLDEFGSDNYLTPAPNKHNDNQITKAPKKDNTRNMCDNISPVRTVKILEHEEYKTDSGKDMNFNEQISMQLRKKLFSLPSKSESSMHSADNSTDSEKLLYCGDILLDSQILSVKLNALCKKTFLTCTINYKTDKQFDKENEAKSITERNNNDDNEIKENNLIITSEDLEGTKFTNENILHDTYSNDVDTLFQHNPKKQKLLFNYVSENTTQSCDPLVTCTSSPEDSSDYIITPDIEMPLKRKKWKVRQNLNSETLPSSTQKNEGCFIYNKKETEGNCVILQQPNLSTKDQQINCLHTEVSRQPLQNIDKENSNVYSRPAGSNEINISTTTEDSVNNFDEVVNDRDSQLMSNYEELSKQSKFKTKLTNEEINRRNAVIAKEPLISCCTNQTEENADRKIQIHRHVLESESFITNKTRKSKEDIGGTSNQTDIFAESNIKLKQKLQGIKKQNVNVSQQLVTDIRQSLDNINDTEQHEDLIEQTDSKNLSREHFQRKKKLNVVTSEPLVIKQSMDNIEGGNKHKDFIDKTCIKRKKQQGVISSDPLVTDIVRQAVDNFEDTYKQEDLFEKSDSTNLSRQEIKRKKYLSMVTTEPLITDANNIKQSMDNNEDGNNHKDFLDKTSMIVTRQEIQRKKQNRVISAEPLVTDIVRQTVDNIEDTYNQEDFIEQTVSTNVSRQEIKRKKHLSMVTTEPLITTDANNIKQSMNHNEGGNNHKDFLDKTSMIVIRQEIQRMKQKGVISSEPLVTDIVRQTVDNIEDMYNQEDFIEQTDSTNLSRQEINRKKHLSIVTTEPLITDANNIKQSMDNNEDGNNHKDILDKTSMIVTRQEIQRKKQKGVISSEPLVTDIVRQTVDNIEDAYNQEDFIEQTDSTNLSRREIKRKKYLSMVTTEPLITDANNIKQSMDNNEDGNNHKDILDKTSMNVTRQEIQRKKQKGVISSEPLVTDIVRQTVDNIEDMYNQEDFIEQTDSTNLSRQEIKRKKHLSMVTTEPLITDANNVKQSMDNNEEGNNHNDFLDKTSMIVTRQEIQRKKQKGVISSEPLVTDIVRQTVDNIEDMYNQEDFIEQTDSTNLSRQEIKRKKHLSMVTTEPLITDANNIKQSMDNNEEGNNHKDFLDKTSMIVTRQEIQRKKQKGVISSEPLVTDIVRQTVDNIEDMYNQEDFIEQTDSTNLSRQEIKRKKHLSMVTTEPLITDANNIKQSMDNNEEGNNHKDFLDKTSMIVIRQEIQRKKQKGVISSEPLVTDIVRQTVDNIEDTYNQEDFIEQTVSTNLSRQEIKRKKHLSMVTTEPLITDANNIKQSMDNNEDGNNHKDFLDKTSMIVTRQEIQRKKQKGVISSEPLVTDIVRQTVDNIEDMYNQEDFIEQTDSTNLSRQEIKRKKHLSMVTTEPLITDANNIKQSMDNNEEGNNHKDFLDKTSMIVTRQEIQRKKQKGVISSEPLVTDIVRQTVDNIEDTYNQEDFIEQTDSTNLSRREIKRKKYLSIVTTEPLITDANNIQQSMNHNEGRNNHKDFLDKTSMIVTRQEIQRKKQKGVISSEPLVTDIIRQTVDNIEDMYNQEDFIEQTDSTNLSRQEIKRKKHLSMVTTEPLITDANNIKQSMDNNEEGNNHKDFLDKTSMIVTRQEIQRKKQKGVISSEPLVTDIVRQTVDNIEDMYNQEDFIEQTDSTNLSRQEIKRKKHLSMVTTEPLITDANNIKQSMDNNEDRNNHKDFLDKTSTILTRQEIQRKKLQGVISSEPLVTDIVRQTVDSIENTYNQEDFIEKTVSTNSSRQDTQKKKHLNVLTSEPLVTCANNVKESLDYIEDANNHKDLLDNTSMILTRQDIQRKKKWRVISSEPLVTNIVEQSEDNIRDMYSEEKFLEQTDSKNISRLDFQKKNHLNVVKSRPLVTIANNVSQSVDNIEDTNNHKDFPDKRSMILTRQDIQWKKQRSVVSSESLVTNIVSQSMDNTNAIYNQECFLEESDSSTLSRQKRKFHSIVLSEPLVTNIVRQSVDNCKDNHEDFISQTDSVTPEFQQLQYKDMLISDPIINNISKRSFHNIDNIHSNDGFSGFTDSAMSSRKEIQSKKQRTMLSSEPLIADDGSQSMYEGIDYHDSFRQINSTSLSGHGFKKKKPKSVINHISLPSLNNVQYSPSYDKFHGQSDFISLSRQEIPRKKIKRVLRSKTMVTDNNNVIMDNTDDFTTSSRHEINRKYQEEVMPETLNTKKQLVNRGVSNDLVDDLTNCEIISLSKQKSTKNKSYNIKPKELGTDSRQSKICFEDTLDDKPDLTIPSLCKNLQLKNTNSGLPMKSKFMIDNLPCTSVVSQVSNDSYSGQILNIEDEETFLNNEMRQRHLIHQTKLKSRNPLLSNVSSCRIVKKKYTPMVHEKENIPFKSIITSYSNNHDESNSEATSPLQTMHDTLTKNSHIYHYSQTTSQIRSSATGAEEYLSTGVTLNERDCNLLSEEDLKGIPDSPKMCTASSESSSVDGRITNTVWSDSNSKSSAGGGYGFDFDLPSYDENSCSENTSLSNSVVTDNVSTDDPWLDI